MTLDLALVHYPVSNKNGEIIGSAVTNLDLHDIVRAGRTYGVRSFYVVTPFLEQQELVGEIIAHWRQGYGATHNKDRKEAFSIIEVVADLESLYLDIEKKYGSRPFTLATSAGGQHNILNYRDTKIKLGNNESLLILFGTASGLAPEVFFNVDAVLPPIGGNSDYNHLSVRSAVAIILDRLLGER